MAQRAACALLAAACALAGLPGGSRAGGPTDGIPRNLRCSKSCCLASCPITCTWEVPGGTTETTSTLHFWYPSEKEKHQAFEAGRATSFVLHQDRVYALTNATAWVESRMGDGRLLRSENRTLLIKRAVKFHPPAATSIAFSRSEGLVTLTWPETHGCHRLSQEKEVRLRPQTVANWTQGDCNPGKEDGDKERAQVVCRVDGNVPYEVQVRYRLSHWSSFWSDWSESVFRPAGIFRSPEVNFTVGRLGEDGLRKITLEWEKPSPDQGEVTYTLTFVPLPCSDCWNYKEDKVVNQTSCQVALSGAGYNVSLQASNNAGEAPRTFFQLPPEQERGPSSLNVSFSGESFRAWWKATAVADVFCFESQALGEPPSETPCGRKDLEPGQAYESSGVVKSNRCYRLAVHGLDLDTDSWSTFGLTHVFQRNASLEDPIQVNVTKRTAHSATVSWEAPRALSACPGVLKKFVLCCRKDEEGSRMMHYEADASEREFAIPDLQPRTAYWVGVWASTDRNGRGCRANFWFLTRSADSKLVHSLLFLGILVAVLVAAAGLHFGKERNFFSRIQEALWPPLPDPTGTEAVKILLAVEPGQVHRWRHFVEPRESGGAGDPFLLEVPVEKEEDSHDSAEAMEDSPGLVPAGEELQPPKEDPLNYGDPLPLAYRAQGLLNLVEEEQQGRENGGGPGGPSVHHDRAAGTLGCSAPERR